MAFKVGDIVVVRSDVAIPYGYKGAVDIRLKVEKAGKLDFLGRVMWSTFLAYQPGMLYEFPNNKAELEVEPVPDIYDNLFKALDDIEQKKI